MKSGRWLQQNLVVVVAAAVLCACGESPSQADRGPRDLGAVVDHGAPLDRATADRTRSDAGHDRRLADVGSSKDASWPPAGPFHSGKTCALPACDPNGAVTTDLSGTWTQTITTSSHDCNALVAVMKPMLQAGHVETVNNLVMPRAGECVYKDKVGGTLVGVIKGNIMITCEVQPVDTGVTPVVESEITFANNTGTGPAWTYLFDVPVAPASCQVNLTTTIKRK